MFLNMLCNLFCFLFSQFNERFLITIQEHVYSCQYGTFIGNCDRQREELNLRQKSYSLWGYIVSHNDEFVNPLYERSTNRDVLRPNVVPQNIRFWRGLYCRFETGAHPREPVIDLLGLAACQTSSLEDHGRQLTKTIGYYTQKISNAKAVGAVVKALTPTNASPLTSASARPSQMMSINSTNNEASFSTTSLSSSLGGGGASNNDLEKVEKKFADLKTSIMEKCQPSST
jgi:myotubularin-related protein 6/7/8